MSTTLSQNQTKGLFDLVEELHVLGFDFQAKQDSPGDCLAVVVGKALEVLRGTLGFPQSKTVEIPSSREGHDGYVVTVAPAYVLPLSCPCKSAQWPDKDGKPTTCHHMLRALAALVSDPGEPQESAEKVFAGFAEGFPKGEVSVAFGKTSDGVPVVSGDFPGVMAALEHDPEAAERRAGLAERLAEVRRKAAGPMPREADGYDGHPYPKPSPEAVRPATAETLEMARIQRDAVSKAHGRVLRRSGCEDVGPYCDLCGECLKCYSSEPCQGNDGGPHQAPREADPEALPTIEELYAQRPQDFVDIEPGETITVGPALPEWDVVDQGGRLVGRYPGTSAGDAVAFSWRNNRTNPASIRTATRYEREDFVSEDETVSRGFLDGDRGPVPGEVER